MRHWPPGQQIHNGKYIIEEILGGGGFGVTYRAQNLKKGEVVAIKTLNANVQGKPNFQELQTKFLNEALSLARCSHPHVVRVEEVFPEMVGNLQLWCMVMELIDGTNLAEYLEDNGILSEEKALPMIQQVGSALSFVHQQNLTHRDVKPLNIMLRRRGLEAVLIDFGLARELTVPGQLKSSSVFGTECFAPIEQYERRAERGPYTDVYSLAVTLYVMLTGELPCPSRFRRPIDPVTPPKQHNSKISDRVNAAIMKGMELEPQNRPQSVQEWLDLVMPKKAALDLGIPKKAETVQFNLLDLGIPKKAETVQLISAVGMDYINLRNLLAAKKWKEADEETARVMLKVAGREKEGWLDEISIEKFPCEDLRTIDQLWVKYSNGRFGFSVQKRIYQSLGRTRKYDWEDWKRSVQKRIYQSLGRTRKYDTEDLENDWEDWKTFADRVGWRKNNEWLSYNNLTFSEKAPEGHLPGLNLAEVWEASVLWNLKVWYLFSRVETCRL
ncbi:serine/threonine-protein kinase [Microcoleus vaginatus]|uniref:serine/threonine-protein kinase n=1 Tax=Microcoleus vaginatus TaxID=119532 RepID=UPI001F6224B1|nr:serine/threonine protein kinase [Microcoleus vaginatus HSN003]